MTNLPTKVTFRIPMPSLLNAETRTAHSPNGGASWQARVHGSKKKGVPSKADLRLEAKNATWAVVGWQGIGEQEATISIDAAWPSAHLTDEDNFWAMFKTVRDGIADALWPRVTFARRDALVRLGELHLVNARKNTHFDVIVTVEDTNG